MNKLISYFELLEELKPLQNELNSYIIENWEKKLTDEDFILAIIDETSELLNSFHWKWWKDVKEERMSEKNIDNIKIELIDLLHFLLSRYILLTNNKFNFEEFLKLKLLNIDIDIFKFNIDIENNEELKNLIINIPNKNFLISFISWIKLVNKYFNSIEEIKESYLKKYFLNKFRKDFGYKNGKYQKFINIEMFDNSTKEFLGTNNVEDNELLDILIKSKNIKLNNYDSIEKYFQELYKNFQEIYKNKKIYI